MVDRACFICSTSQAGTHALPLVDKWNVGLSVIGCGIFGARLGTRTRLQGDDDGPDGQAGQLDR